MKSFDLYHDATGKAPPPMPPGGNTTTIPFRLIDENGVERAALLVHQTGFEQTPEEKAAGEEASGLTVAVALDAPADEGARVLSEWSEKMLWPDGRGDSK